MKPLIDRFSSKYRIDSETGCWLWTSTRHGKGYGHIHVKTGYGRRKIAKAHRVSYELYVGPVPEGMFVCHKCDNPPCVNPAHLFVGSNRENIIDARSKGRLAIRRGKNVLNAKLTDDQVRAILDLHRTGWSHRAIGRAFNITHANVGYVVRGKTWQHVPR